MNAEDISARGCWLDVGFEIFFFFRLIVRREEMSGDVC